METERWERVDCSRWEVLSNETQSSEEAIWLRDTEKVNWLYKAATVQPRDGRRDGEDWAELIATIVAEAMGVPCAYVRLCVGSLGEGSISRSVIPELYDMHEGRVWVPDRLGLDEYRPRSSGPTVNRPGHSLESIRKSLEGVLAAPGAEDGADLDGFDTFAGYLCLDALIANCDRHEQNWAVLEPSLAGDEPLRLAPSFDHASGLGYNLPDAKRQARVDDPDLLLRFARKGIAHRFEHPKASPPLTLVEAAAHGLALASSSGRAFWVDRVHELDLSHVLEEIDAARCDAMSVPARTMAEKLLKLNLGRLRDELDHRI